MTPWSCSPPGSSVHGISQGRIMECVAIYSSKGSSWPMSPTLAGHLDHWATWETYIHKWIILKKNLTPSHTHTHTHTHTLYPYDVIIAYVFSWAKNFLTKILGSSISNIGIQYLEMVRCYKNHLTASFSSSHLLHLGDRFKLVLSSLNLYEINLQNKTESTWCLCFCKSLFRIKFDIFPLSQG